jgi:Ca2+-dependent lipid-binding protein
MDRSYRGLLLVHLQGGKNLISADINGLSDPYVLFRLGDVAIKSRVVEKSLNPLWNETINIIADGITEKKLICKVMDKDILTDDFLGEAVVDFSSLNNMEEKLFKVDLSQVKSGTITLFLRWIDLSKDDNLLIDKYGFPALFENAAEAISKETTYDTSSPPGVGLIKTVGKTGIPYAHKTGCILASIWFASSQFTSFSLCLIGLQ